MSFIILYYILLLPEDVANNFITYIGFLQWSPRWDLWCPKWVFRRLLCLLPFLVVFAAVQWDLCIRYVSFSWDLPTGFVSFTLAFTEFMLCICCDSSMQPIFFSLVYTNSWIVCPHLYKQGAQRLKPQGGVILKWGGIMRGEMKVENKKYNS